jgi:hypothetical protein
MTKKKIVGDKICKGPEFGKTCSNKVVNYKRIYCDECRRIRKRASHGNCRKKAPDKYYLSKTNGPKDNFFQEFQPKVHNIISDSDQFQIDKEYRKNFEIPREDVKLEPKNIEVIKRSPYTKSIAWLVS